MRLQNRSGGHGTDFSLKAGLRRPRLALTTHTGNDLPRFKNLANRHGQGLSRNLCQRSEPTFVHLLLPARLVEIHHQIRVLGFKVRRRIIESQMSVLANSHKCHIDRRGVQLASHLLNDILDIPIAVEQVIFSDACFLDEPLEQISSECRARW